MPNAAKRIDAGIKQQRRLEAEDLNRFADRHAMSIAEAQSLSDRLNGSLAAMEAAVRLLAVGS